MTPSLFKKTFNLYLAKKEINFKIINQIILILILIHGESSASVTMI